VAERVAEPRRQFEAGGAAADHDDPVEGRVRRTLLLLRRLRGGGAVYRR
jgi:hypothetical protein